MKYEIDLHRAHPPPTTNGPIVARTGASIAKAIAAKRLAHPPSSYVGLIDVAISVGANWEQKLWLNSYHLHETPDDNIVC